MTWSNPECRTSAIFGRRIKYPRAFGIHTPYRRLHSGHMTTTTPPRFVSADSALQQKILSLIAKKTFCTVATTSPAGHPHVAGVVYEFVDGTMWIHTLAQSRKARSIKENSSVAVCVPYRHLPVGPPYTIHFQGSAELIAMNDGRVTQLLADGKLASISGHGALDMPDGCFLAIQPRGRVHSFGPGVKTLDLIRDPLNSGARSFLLSDIAR